MEAEDIEVLVDHGKDCSNIAGYSNIASPSFSLPKLFGDMQEMMAKFMLLGSPTSGWGLESPGITIPPQTSENSSIGENGCFG